MKNPRVLVSGASIAGPALAYWLHRYGFEPVVVERAPALRTGGQNVDVRGAGREVTRRMGLEDAVREATTGEVGTRFLRPDGTTAAEFPAGRSDTGGATAELEILRGDLAQLLVDATDDDVEYRFGDRISGLDDTGDGVSVRFEGGSTERFDLVVAADGVGSSTRELVVGGEVSYRYLGMETTFATIPRTGTDDDWWRWFNATGGRTMTLRPDAVGTIRATLSYPPPSDGATRRTVEEQRTNLRERFADAGWEAERILAGLDTADDLYFETLRQVRAPRWSSGRVALLGDAAYCASPISGMGTSLALTGAYVLAGELAAHVDHRDAFRGYERIVRPYVEKAQKLPPGTPRIANPRSRAGIAALGFGLRLASTPLVGKLGSRLFTPPADEVDLPDYSHLEV